MACRKSAYSKAPKRTRRERSQQRVPGEVEICCLLLRGGAPDITADWLIQNAGVRELQLLVDEWCRQGRVMALEMATPAGSA